MAYCEPDDLLTGNIPTPAYVSKDQYVTLAANEIDAALGTRYVTPIAFSADPANRPSELLLKQTNIYIASGLLITAAAAGGSDSQVHAYGLMLLQMGRDALRKIYEGSVEIVGAMKLDGSATSQSGVPLVVNGDPYSMVDEFYKILHPSGASISAGRGWPYAY